jgi:acyl-CoA thioesterase
MARKKTASSPKPAARRLRLQNYRHPDQFGNWLGYEVKALDFQRHAAKVALKIRSDHLSPAGRVHGGVISALFDYAFGASVFTTLGPRDFCSTVELKVNYFRPIELGDRLRADTRVVFRGRRLCVLEGFLYRLGMKDPVAMGTATFNVVPAK